MLRQTLEGPAKADITCTDNKNGTVDVSFLPTVPGDYTITVKFADEHVAGSPFTCKVNGLVERSSKRITIQTGADSGEGFRAVKIQGPGIDRPSLGELNSFIVDCSQGGNDVLFISIYGPDKSQNEVYVKHQGENKYGVSYKLMDPGKYILYVKWGDQHVHGSPFHFEV